MDSGMVPLKVLLSIFLFDLNNYKNVLLIIYYYYKNYYFKSILL